MTKTSIRKRLREAGASINIAFAESDDPALIVAAIAKATSELDTALKLAVAHARDRGASWRDIGRALGVTGQSAWERFAPEDER